MRNLGELIDRMVEKIPADQTDLLHDLDNVVDSIRYTPPEPEAIIYRFRQVAEIFGAYFGDEPTEDWQKEVIDIWMDTE